MLQLRRLLAVALLLAASTAHARTWEQIKADGKIVIASEGAFPPFNYFDGPKLTGFEIEIAEAVARKMGVQVEWKALSFDALLAGLRQDRWDAVIASFGITAERAKAAEKDTIDLFGCSARTAWNCCAVPSFKNLNLFSRFSQRPRHARRSRTPAVILWSLWSLCPTSLLA